MAIAMNEAVYMYVLLVPFPHHNNLMAIFKIMLFLIMHVNIHIHSDFLQLNEIDWIIEV